MSQVLCKRCHGTGDGDPASDRPVCWECDGKGYVAGCSVGGCERPADEQCEVCGEEVCAGHSKAVLGMRLCWSCEIGMSEGIGAAMRGGW